MKQLRFLRLPIWSRWKRTHRKVAYHPDWLEYVPSDWLDTIFRIEVSDRYHAKQGRSIGRWQLRSSEGKNLVVYLKRHFKLSRTSGILALLFPGRAWSPGYQEWHHLQWAQDSGIPVPRPMAAAEFLGPCGKLQSFLAVEELTGMLPLHEAIPLAKSRLSKTGFQKWKSKLIRAMVPIVVRLHSKHYYHKDLYLCHFYIPEAQIGELAESHMPDLFLIDFHRLGYHPLKGIWFGIKDLAQLGYSSLIPGISQRDRLEFWLRYRQASGKSAKQSFWSKIWLQLIQLKANRYHKHNQQSMETH